MQSSGGFDPRSAATLLDDIASVEERTIRNEIEGVRSRPLRRAKFDEIATAALIRLMRQDLERNSKLLEGSQIADIPRLVESSKQLAAGYREDPRFLLAKEQRQTFVPRLLTSFLIVELLSAGWIASYSAEEGITLHFGESMIRPSKVVKELFDNTLSKDQFLALVGHSGDTPK